MQSSRGGAKRPRNNVPRHRRKSSYSKKSASIPTDRFINQAVAPEADTPYQPENSFNDFALNPKLKQTLNYLGYEAPSPIQDQCIPLISDGSDVIGLANTGTGKTAAFLLPTIEKLSNSRRPIDALVLAPTRELAQQIDEEFRKFSAGQKVYSTLVVGGANMGRQIQGIRRGPHIIIGTPGRIKDLIERKVLRLSTISTLILDEADRMCDMGFSKDIRWIARELPADRQTLCFSATMTKQVKLIVEEFMNQPATVSVVKRQTSAHIDQSVVYASGKDEKLEKLVELLNGEKAERVIIFGDTKFGVQRLADTLTKQGLAALAIHGNKSQPQRERALRDFKSNRVNILVATDVAARGLDIPDVSHVINFDTPKIYDDYIHRIGRTGRAGNRGTAITFVDGRQN